jgi:hypothetical protein
MDRLDTARGKGNRLIVYSREGLGIYTEDKQVNFHQYRCFTVRDSTMYPLHRSPNAPPVAMKDMVKLVESIEKNAVMV